MPIPDYQSAMLPILLLTADGADHTLAEGVETIAKEFKVTDEEAAAILRLHHAEKCLGGP